MKKRNISKPPTNCPFCNGEREWSGKFSKEGDPEAHCGFCGNSTIVCFPPKKPVTH